MLTAGHYAAGLPDLSTKTAVFHRGDNFTHILSTVKVVENCGQPAESAQPSFRTELCLLWIIIFATISCGFSQSACVE
jgi:hypothetical protein